MERTIISHNTTTAIARVKFVHKDVIVEDNFDLKRVVPGSIYTFDQMGIVFDESYQLKALDRLTLNIEKQIDEGVLTNPPEPTSTTSNNGDGGHQVEETGTTEESPTVESEEEPTEENTNPET